MVDLLQTVCCMCGDVGFPDKLFRCHKCRHRFQHSYCSNYYGELAEIELCDWCQSEEIKNNNNISTSSGSTSSGFSKNPLGNDAVLTNRSEYSGPDKIKQHDHHHREDTAAAADKGKSPTPSPRPTTRRYKLLKDVMC